MELSTLDYGLIIGFFTIVLVIGAVVSKKSGKNTSEYFLSGRNMPWWLLGFSMVATTFSTDTPNLVIDIVRKNSVSGNWIYGNYPLAIGLTIMVVLSGFLLARVWNQMKDTIL